ncbi:SDR family oxidoreductase [Actinoplanes awajinensis]|uniref:NmrA family transcriptional regulator n=1 Tax=Actinoplanes awajinensis subsp. mycoplanecinus TaxID=135947 RepID=A0A101JRP9_9ACTN|nr:NAD(P)H-binding protein [Actinoplanes awajinensis]KUL31221.1 NmrA family transcriptional regulator [Actinoplanes awajinensis subsp. mycoplanecinus]
MYVVTGATGNVGRSLVAALAAAGAEVRAVSRTDPGRELPGARHHRADLADPVSLRPVVAGAEAFFLLVAGAGAHLDGPAILDVVRAGGVRRVVLLSSQAAGTRPDAASHAPLRALERTVRDSGLGWTVLRPGGFMSNTFAWAEPVRVRRAVAAPFGDVGLPLVDPADIAAVAAVALRDPAHAGRVYELTGPEPSTPRQRAARIAAALGEPVRFTEQTRAQAREQLLGFMPAPVADGTLDIIGTPTPAEERVSPDVARVLGRPAGGFDGWLERNLAAFR